jgi:hypothetical protein
VKFVFLQETNHEKGWLLLMQFWNALWNRGLMFRLAYEANNNSLPDGVELLNSEFVDSGDEVEPPELVGHERVGIVSGVVSTLHDVLEPLTAQAQEETRVLFHSDTFGMLYNLYVAEFGQVTFRNFGNVESLSVAMSNLLRIRVGSGFRVPITASERRTLIIRPLSHCRRSVVDNCVLELEDNVFVIVLEVIESCNAALNRSVLVFAKCLVPALLDGLKDPLHGLILLRDTNRDERGSHIILHVSNIVAVWSAIFVATPVNENPLLFIDNKVLVEC